MRLSTDLYGFKISRSSSIFASGLIAFLMLVCSSSFVNFCHHGFSYVISDLSRLVYVWTGSVPNNCFLFIDSKSSVDMDTGPPCNLQASRSLWVLVIFFFGSSFFLTTSFWFNFTVLMNYLYIAFTSSTSLLVLASLHFLLFPLLWVLWMKAPPGPCLCWQYSSGILYQGKHFPHWLLTGYLVLQILFTAWLCQWIIF